MLATTVVVELDGMAYALLAEEYRAKPAGACD